jgi:Leucine-rich repeat (LRR) protein
VKKLIFFAVALLLFGCLFNNKHSDADARAVRAILDSNGLYDVNQRNSSYREDGRLYLLDLSHLGLKTIPSDIGELDDLVILYLTKNKLTELPPEFGNLTSLKRLHLDSNQLTSLPPEILNLQSLTQFLIYGNFYVNWHLIKLDFC